MKRMVLGVSRGKKIDPQPHPIGWIQVAQNCNLQEKMVVAYQRLGVNPYLLFQYRNEEGQELMIVYQEFLPTTHGSLEEITSAEHLSKLANQWLRKVNG